MERMSIVLGLSAGTLLGAALSGGTTGMIFGVTLITLYSLVTIIYDMGINHGKN